MRLMGLFTHGMGDWIGWGGMASIWAKMAPPFNFHPWGNTIPWPMNILHYSPFVGQPLWGCNCFVTKCNIGSNLTGGALC